MRILVSGQTRYLAELAVTAAERHLGVLLQPNQFNDIRALLSMNLPLAIDNAAYSNRNDDGLWNLLINGWELAPWIMWLSVPDVVEDAKATIEEWHSFISSLEYEIGQVPPVPLAFVAQDGLEDLQDEIPWAQFSCLFIGASTKWKLGSDAVALCREARRRGKMVHVGRVNSQRRALYARDVMGADTVDGTSFSRFGRVKIPPALKALARPIQGYFEFQQTGVPPGTIG